MRLPRSLRLVLIMALLLSGAARPDVAFPVDQIERILPGWAHHDEAKVAQAPAAHDGFAAIEPVTIASVEDDSPQVVWRPGAQMDGPPDLTWRESFLVSRQNTKYKDVAAFSG